VKELAVAPKQKYDLFAAEEFNIDNFEQNRLRNCPVSAAIWSKNK